jgi:hypothetical protein
MGISPIIESRTAARAGAAECGVRSGEGTKWESTQYGVDEYRGERRGYVYLLLAPPPTKPHVAQFFPLQTATAGHTIAFVGNLYG